MIQYDPGRWSIGFAFTLKGSVFPKSVIWALPCSLVSVVLHHFINANPDFGLHVGAGDVGASVLSGFTFILGFLIVFRSQQAYSRWWEGGTLLQQLRGEWFNAYSSLLAFCNTSPDKREEVLAFQHKLARLCSLLYCTAIQQVSTMEDKNYELIDVSDFDGDSMKYMMDSPDRCEVCLQWIQRLIGDADEQKVLKVAPPILSRVYNQLGNGIVVLNNARKITEFPMPFPLAQMVTCMLLLHWGITAVVCAASVQEAAWAGILSFIVTFSFWSINYIAVELEQPFGDDANDLPLHEMQANLNQSLKRLLHQRAQQAPAFHFNDEEHLTCKRSKSFLEELEFSQSSQLKPAVQEAIDVNHVDFPQQVRAPPQFASDMPPTKTQLPMVATTCWSAGAVAATGAATSLMSMTSRTAAAPEPNGVRTAEAHANTVVYGAPAGASASVFPKDTQGSSAAPAVKSAAAMHSQAPPDLNAEIAVSMSEAPSTRHPPTRRTCSLQEAPIASCQWEKQHGPPSQLVPALSVLSRGSGTPTSTSSLSSLEAWALAFLATEPRTQYCQHV